MLDCVVSWVGLDGFVAIMPVSKYNGEWYRLELDAPCGPQRRRSSQPTAILRPRLER